MSEFIDSITTVDVDVCCVMITSINDLDRITNIRDILHKLYDEAKAHKSYLQSQAPIQNDERMINLGDNMDDLLDIDEVLDELWENKSDDDKSKEESKDKPEDKSKDEAEDKPEDKTKEESKDNPKGESKDEAEDNPEDKSKEESKDKPKGESKENHDESEEESDDKHDEWVDRNGEAYAKWKSSVLETCRLNVSRSENPGPQEHIWKSVVTECTFTWLELFGMKNVRFEVNKSVDSLDHAGDETDISWSLSVNGKRVSAGNDVLGEDDEGLFDVFENEYTEVVCTVGDGIIITTEHVHKFFKYLIDKIDDLPEDDDD